ncbi:MAG: hypothetical protein KatS3mg057_0657 [Herpetosiphonaceae bacterium]|nr:MAG: hypothetical protein KatS3mg057_0657 [Herpetosiphonaceae bacterium]
MAREKLRQLENWQLENPGQDIRGWPVLDESGNRLGMVDDLIVDTDRQLVVAAVLQDGTEISTDTIRMGDQVVYTRTAPREADVTGEEIRIPTISEEVDVGKRTIERGGAQVDVDVEERPVSKQVRLRDEEVEVHHEPADRPARPEEIDQFKEGSFTVPEREEVPTVEKEARVVGETVIEKRTEEREETVEGTARKTDVDVKKLEEEEKRKRRR